MKSVWTLDQILSQLTKAQIRWGPASVAYAFYTSPWAHVNFKTGFAPFSADQHQFLARSMQLISDVANITFHQVPDNGLDTGPNNRRINFYNANSPSYLFTGAAHNFWVDQATQPFDTIYGADVAINLDRAGTGVWNYGGKNQRILLHELLHTLGIGHPGNYNGDGTTYANDALFYQDSHQYTVMSYFSAAETGADHSMGNLIYSATTPMLLDVAALQSLYGANMTTRTGDTVYGFNSTAEREAFDLALHPYSIFTVWDAGGTDTLDLSGFTSRSRINLEPGSFSDAGEMTGNISIAYGSSIENAIGGGGNDVISGNSLNNRLEGGGGGDRLYGAEGGDIFAYGQLGDSTLSSMSSEGRKIASDYLPDFTPGVDKIDLSALDADLLTAGDQAFAFIGMSAFSGNSGELRYQVNHGQLELLGDVNGDGVADFMIASNAPSISAGDLIL